MEAVMAQQPAVGEVRKTPSWPRSWANFSLFQLCSHRNSCANLDLLGQPNTSPLSLEAIAAGVAAALHRMEEPEQKQHEAATTALHPLTGSPPKRHSPAMRLSSVAIPKLPFGCLRKPPA
jgi:hypothetical protein